MSEGESIPPIPVEAQISSLIVRNLKSVRKNERKLSSLGSRDRSATQAFHDYHLPGQEHIRETAEGPIRMIRALLDPEEYVVRIEGEKGFNNFLKAIQADKQRIRKGAKKDGFPHYPIGTTMEIIVGEADNPGVCYRFTILDAQRQRKEVIFTVGGNVEYEKDSGPALSAARFSQAQKAETEAIEEANPEGEGKEEKPSVIIRESSLTERQKRIVTNPFTMAIGGRTGSRVLHQRSPVSTTLFIDEDNSNLEIDPTRDHLWLVVLDAKAYRQSQEEIKKRNFQAKK